MEWNFVYNSYKGLNGAYKGSNILGNGSFCFFEYQNQPTLVALNVLNDIDKTNSEILERLFIYLYTYNTFFSHDNIDLYQHCNIDRIISNNHRCYGNKNTEMIVK